MCAKRAFRRARLLSGPLTLFLISPLLGLGPVDVARAAAGPDIDVDTDRNGMLTESDEDGEDAFTTQRGAIFQVNLDDDNGDGTDAATYDPLTGTPTENLKLDGPSDKADLAEIRVDAATSAGSTKVELAADPLDLPAFHLFDSATDRHIWGGGADRRVKVDVTSFLDRGKGVLLLEGILFRSRQLMPAFPWHFDGDLRVHLIVSRDGRELGRDAVTLRVAPFLLLDNTQAASQVFVSADREGLAVPLQNSGVSVTLTTDGNQWTQDHVEMGYTHAPGRPKMQSSFRLPYENDGPPPDWPAELLSGPNAGVFSAGRSLGGGGGDYGGNVELLPPSDANPLGRVVIGNTRSDALFGFLSDQARDDQPNQLPIQVDTEWLRVGHVDEIFGFRPKPGTDPGFGIVFASPSTAYCLLGEPTTLQGGPCPDLGVAAPLDSAPFFALDGRDADNAAETAAGVATRTLEPGNATLFDTGNKNFMAEEWEFVRIYAGPGAGQVARITHRGDGFIRIGTVYKTGSAVVQGPGEGPASKVPCLESCLVNRIESKQGWYENPVPGSSKYVLVEASQKWLDGARQEFPAVFTVGEVKKDNTLRAFNREAERRIIGPEGLRVLQQAAPGVGVDNVPVIFMGRFTRRSGIVNGSGRAWTPGLANFQPVDGKVYFARQFSPRARGVQDVFESYATSRISTAKFVDDWNLYHRLMGEVHCGTNVRRNPFVFNWWEKEP